MVNTPKKPMPGEDPQGHGADLDSDMDFLDDPEALLAAEEAALEAEAEAEEAEQSHRKPTETPAVLKAQIAELTDRLLRAHAELENQRKMAEKDRQDTAKYAISKFAKDIVQVGDNFQRAITAVPDDAVEKDPALKSFLDGVTMLDREFHNILERHNIERLAPVGEAFDPHFHQAMMEQEDTTVPHGTVLQVIQSGYLLSDRVLRPAMVIVAKGGAKASAGAAPKPQESGTEPPAADADETQSGSSSGPDPSDTT